MTHKKRARDCSSCVSSEDDSHPIKKIIYDKWNKFFKEIKVSESDKYYISDKDTFLDSLNLDYNKSKYNAQIAYYSSPENRKKGLLSYQTVIDNPGFAPLYTSGNAVYEYNGERFAITTGLFNEDYQHLKAYRHLKEFYHEGVDFRGSWDKNKPNEKGTPVKALINCKVIAYGWYSTYGQVIFMSKTNDVGIYLIAHLSFYADDIKVGKEYLPGEIVGYVGGSGKDKKTGKYELDCWDSHLHVSYYNLRYLPTDTYIMTKNDEICLDCKKYSVLIENRYNPFIHNSGVKNPQKN